MACRNGCVCGEDDLIANLIKILVSQFSNQLKCDKACVPFVQMERFYVVVAKIAKQSQSGNPKDDLLN